MKLPWWLAPNGKPPADWAAGPSAAPQPLDLSPVTKLNPPPPPTTLHWIADRRPTAADALDGNIQVLTKDRLVGITSLRYLLPGGCWADCPWTHCLGWGEPVVLVPSKEDLQDWVKEFALGNAAGDPDCLSIVDFIARRTAEWTAAQRTRTQ